MRYTYRISSGVSQEVKDLIIADIALTVAFTLLRLNPLGGVLSLSSLAFLLPVSFVAVTLSFILHEYMHKIVAQHFGAIAAFHRSDMGILMTLATSMLGFLIALPGATIIYTNTFTRRQEGYVSLAGPLTNFAVFGIFFILALYLHPAANSYLGSALQFIWFISLWIAFVNMLPVYPLDGSKVLRWNMPVYVLVLSIIVTLFYFFQPSILANMILVFILSLLMSVFYRGIIFR